MSIIDGVKRAPAWLTVLIPVGFIGLMVLFGPWAPVPSVMAQPGPSSQATVITPDCQVFFQFTATGASASLDNRARACTSWTLAYQVNTFTAVSVVVEATADNNGVPGTWGTFAGTVTSGANPSTASPQGLATIVGFAPWIRINLASTTGAGGVSGVLYGYKTGPIGGATSSGAVNIDSVGGTAITLGQKTMAASFPVVVASDQTTFAVTPGVAVTPGDGGTNAGADSRTGAATSAQMRVLPSLFNGSTWDREFACTGQAAVTFTAANGTVEVVAAVASAVVRVCHISLASDTETDFKILSGTGVACGTGPADLTGVYQNVLAVAFDYGAAGALRTAASKALCVNSTATITAGGVVIYAQY
jgi:hypothetical protein